MAVFKRGPRTLTGIYYVTDGNLREYLTDSHRAEAPQYINPTEITVAIDPDTASAIITLAGPYTRQQGKGVIIREYSDFILALDSTTDPLIRQAVLATVEDAARDLPSLLDVKEFIQ